MGFDVGSFLQEEEKPRMMRIETPQNATFLENPDFFFIPLAPIAPKKFPS
jgi:hypothetical protein